MSNLITQQCSMMVTSYYISYQYLYFIYRNKCFNIFILGENYHNVIFI